MARMMPDSFLYVGVAASQATGFTIVIDLVLFMIYIAKSAKGNKNEERGGASTCKMRKRIF